MQNSKTSGSLKNKFAGFGAEPSEGLWDSIAVELDEKKKRRGIIWWWFGGIAATSALMVGIYQYGFYQGVESLNKQKVMLDEPVEDDAVDLPNEKSIVEGVDNARETKIEPIATENENYSSESSGDNHQLNKDEQLNGNSTKNDDIIVESYFNSDKNPVILPTIEFVNETDIPFMAPPYLKKVPYLPGIDFRINGLKKDELQTNSPTTHKWFWGIEMTSRSPLSLANPGYVSNTFLPTASAGNYNAGAETITNSGDGFFDAGVALNVTEIWVEPAIGVSFTIGKYISNRISLSSGLELSLLRFQTWYGMTDLEYAKTNIYTLGIPLKINYDLIHKKRFNFNITAGIINEFPIVEVTKTSNYNSVENQSFVKFGFMGGLQFEMGAEFKIGEKTALRISPSYRWYYAQYFKSVHPVIRRNSWLGGTIGLKWDFN